MNFPDRMRKATPSIRWTKAVESNPPVLGATFSSGKTEAGFEAKAALEALKGEQTVAESSSRFGPLRHARMGRSRRCRSICRLRLRRRKTPKSKRRIGGRIRHDSCFGGVFHALADVDRIGLAASPENARDLETQGVALRDMIAKVEDAPHPTHATASPVSVGFTPSAGGVFTASDRRSRSAHSWDFALRPTNNRPVFVDETWVKTNMAPLRGRAPKRPPALTIAKAPGRQTACARSWPIALEPDHLAFFAGVPS